MQINCTICHLSGKQWKETGNWEHVFRLSLTRCLCVSPSECSRNILQTTLHINESHRHLPCLWEKGWAAKGWNQSEAPQSRLNQFEIVSKMVQYIYYMFLIISHLRREFLWVGSVKGPRQAGRSGSDLLPPFGNEQTFNISDVIESPSCDWLIANRGPKQDEKFQHRKSTLERYNWHSKCSEQVCLHSHGFYEVPL